MMNQLSNSYINFESDDDLEGGPGHVEGVCIESVSHCVLPGQVVRVGLRGWNQDQRSSEGRHGVVSLARLLFSV